jgi:ankyrin repeat protein
MIENGCAKICSVLIKRGVQVNFSRKDQTSPLFVAAEKNFSDVLEVLIANGANVNEFRSDGTSPLIIAASQGNLKAVKQLLDAGASTSLALRGKTASEWATFAGHTEIASLIDQKKQRKKQIWVAKKQ